MIEAKNISKSFGKLQVLKGVNVSIKKGEIVSIVGSSGAGKTTLLQILSSLDKADAGSIEINTTLISDLRDKKLAQFRNKNIGFVFQFHHLLPEFTALENVCIPAYIGGASKADAEAKATELLNFLGLAGHGRHP